jgi:hypothetical protein
MRSSVQRTPFPKEAPGIAAGGCFVPLMRSPGLDFVLQIHAACSLAGGLPTHGCQGRRLERGAAGSLAPSTLRLLGHDATDIVGGFQPWRQRGLPVAR